MSISKSSKPDISDLGVEVGSILGGYLFNSDYLHYGYWPDDLEVKASNVREAQRLYAQLIHTHIPGTVSKVLDVGCGVGKFAEELLDKGYEVDCVSPSAFLTGKTRDRLGDRVHIYESRFEDIQTDRTYDLILFSESFQYIHIRPALNKSIELMADDAHLLICDFFRREAVDNSPIRGGHSLDKFYDFVQDYPLKLITDLDVTRETAPSLDIINELLTNLELPMVGALGDYLTVRHPMISRAISWIFKSRIDGLIERHRATNRESFTRFKSYHLFLYQRGVDL